MKHNLKKGSIIKGIIYIIFILLSNLIFYTKLSYSTHFSTKDFWIFLFLSVIITIIITLLIFYIIKNKNEKPEKIFLILALIVGILYLLATPLFKGHDEQYHWYRSYEISLGKFLTYTNEEYNCIGNNLPVMVGNIYSNQGDFTKIGYRVSN